MCFTRRCIPLQEPRRGWVPVDRRQVEIHRLVGLFGPATAAFYADACQLVAHDPQLASATHLVGHLLRELESALREVLRPMVPAEQTAGSTQRTLGGKEPKQSHKQEIDAIAMALGFPPDDEVRSLWRMANVPTAVPEFRSRWDASLPDLLWAG